MMHQALSPQCPIASSSSLSASSAVAVPTRWPKAIRLAGETATCTDCGAVFDGGRYARFCPVCRPLHRRHKRQKYVLGGVAVELLRERYDSSIRGRVAEIALKLGWPKWTEEGTTK